jgi:hypothetical protein
VKYLYRKKIKKTRMYKLRACATTAPLIEPHEGPCGFPHHTISPHIQPRVVFSVIPKNPTHFSWKIWGLRVEKTKKMMVV